MARTKAEAIRRYGKDGADRKKRRCRPGTKAKREIKRYQIGKQATKTLIPKLSMERLVREIAQEYKTDLRFQGDAIEALQQASEDFIVDLFKKANVIRAHSKRETLGKGDIHVTRQVMSTTD